MEAEQKHPDYPKQFLVQRFVEIDNPGGAWISLKIFKTKAEAEQALAARGVLVLPDFIANAGGVICAAIEYRGGTEGAALALIAEKIRVNTEAVLDEVRRTGALPRTAASLATERVRRAMRTRRWDATAG